MMAFPQTVLIVENNDTLRQTLRTVLALEGYVTLEAADGVDAVNTLRLSPDPLIVLLDVLMPRMSGLDVLDLIDGSLELARHVYIVMTVDESAIDAAHAAILARHDISMLGKPFDLSRLLETLARAASRLI